MNTKCSLCFHSRLDLCFFFPVRELMCVSPVLWSSSCLLLAGIWLPGPPGLLLWKAPEGGRLLPGLLSDGNGCLHTAKTSHWHCEAEVGEFVFCPATLSHTGRFFSYNNVSRKGVLHHLACLRCKRNSMTPLSAPAELPWRDEFGMWHLKGNVSTDVFKYYQDICVFRMSWAALVWQI